MRDDYLREALAAIPDPYILVNVVSKRVKQLRAGHRALVESLEKLSLPDTALREIAEGRIHYEFIPEPTVDSEPVQVHDPAEIFPIERMPLRKAAAF